MDKISIKVIGDKAYEILIKNPEWSYEKIIKETGKILNLN